KVIVKYVEILLCVVFKEKSKSFRKLLVYFFNLN
ncbi:MAG: hypothetical protein ACI8QG_002617, partial [Flavobacteriales bacterium]